MIHLRLPKKKIITKIAKPYPILTLAMVSMTKSLILFVTISSWAASMAILWLNPRSAIAQTPPTATQGQSDIKTMSQVNVLFVNPSIGDDKIGNGTQHTPFKTITQALRVATTNTVIMLAEGTYNANTGEIFPLILKPGISIQGDQASKGSRTVITGGGDYLSFGFGSKNTTIVGVNQSELSGVTVTNPNPRGYGMWIESSNPIVKENTFAGNIQDGIAITGDSTAIISKNIFERNGANGITVSGHSHPQLRENLLRETGYGINIVDDAQPLIVSDVILNNRSGILAQGSSRPVLRGNLIQSSREDGLVVIGQAIPDLGTTSQPGGNQFSNNARYDINAEADKQKITGYGNTLASSRIVGNVDIGDRTATLEQSQLQANREITFAAPNIPDTSSKLTQLTVQNQPPKPLEFPTPTQQPLTVAQNQPPKSLEFPTPTQQPLNQIPTPDTPQVNYVHIDTKSVDFSAPQPFPSPKPERLATAPSSMNFRYKVIVEVHTQRDEQIVRFLAPDAFPAVWQGRTVMQAGVFSSSFYARNMVNMLNNNGLQAIIQRY